MRRMLMWCLMAAAMIVSVGCEKDHATDPENEPELGTELSRNEFSTRIEAAREISDPAKRDESLAVLVREATVSGRIQAVVSAIELIGAPELRDKVAASAALKLATVNAGDGALRVAKMISNVSLRDETLAKLVRGQTKE